MQKRSYTKLDSIKNEILKMRASGWSNSEVADHFGLKVRQIKNLINRHNRREKQLAQGILPKPKGDLVKKRLKQNWNGCGWKTNCCGIFCNSQEGSEAESKVSCYP